MQSALNKEDRQNIIFAQVDSLNYWEKPVSILIQRFEFLLLLHEQIFTR